MCSYEHDLHAHSLTCIQLAACITRLAAAATRIHACQRCSLQHSPDQSTYMCEHACQPTLLSSQACLKHLRLRSLCLQAAARSIHLTKAPMCVRMHASPHCFISSMSQSSAPLLPLLAGCSPQHTPGSSNHHHEHDSPGPTSSHSLISTPPALPSLQAHSAARQQPPSPATAAATAAAAARCKSGPLSDFDAMCHFTMTAAAAAHVLYRNNRTCVLLCRMRHSCARNERGTRTRHRGQEMSGREVAMMAVPHFRFGWVVRAKQLGSARTS
eukprot:1151181-Pelagomonas_calceolata.AAC.9